jgi:nucleotide-binding universal stress UspA family protein
MKLLLAIDGSPYSAPPVRAAATRPWPPSSVVRVLSVVESQYPPGFVPEAPLVPNLTATQKALRDEAEALVESVAETVRKAGLRTEVSVRDGTPGDEIVEEATSWGADLILMGSHGRTALKRVLMGSVAQYVVRHAPCSVEVVRTPAARNAAASIPEGREGKSS